jgi:hypothetical protein
LFLSLVVLVIQEGQAQGDMFLLLLLRAACQGL